MQRVLDAVGVWSEQISVREMHQTDKTGRQLFGVVMSKAIGRGLAERTLGGHPYEVIPGGLHGVQDALYELRDRKRGGNAKFVTRIADTPGMNADANSLFEW